MVTEFKLEKEMRPVVFNYFNGIGYECVHEISDAVDVVVFKFEPRTGRPIPSLKRVMAIELKLTDWKRVVVQAGRHRWKFSETYIAMPKSFIERNIYKIMPICKAEGIGVISVSMDGCEILNECKAGMTSENIKRTLWNRSRLGIVNGKTLLDYRNSIRQKRIDEWKARHPAVLTS